MTTTVRDEDWYGEDISGRTAEDTEFVRCDFSETTSTAGVSFVGCTLRMTKLNVSVHIGAAFTNCTFIDCTFFGSRFEGCKFVGATFRDCVFDQLTVDGGDWSFTALRGADLRNVTIRGARMREADLNSANCSGATIRDVDLSGAQLAKTDFAKADLRGTDLSALDPWESNVRGARIDGIQAMTVAMAMGLDVRD